MADGPGDSDMERTQQVIGQEGLHIPLPWIAQVGLHPGVEVIVEFGENEIRIIPAAPTRADIENRALRTLLKYVGDAVQLKVEPKMSGATQTGWQVRVYASGLGVSLGQLDYSPTGELLSDLPASLNAIRSKAASLAAAP
jgi:hypothetical protein